MHDLSSVDTDPCAPRLQVCITPVRTANLLSNPAKAFVVVVYLVAE